MNFKNDCLMKNLFKVLFVAVATTVLFACTKEPENEPAIIRTVEFAAGPISRTVFGTPEEGEIPTLWTVNKTVGISLNLASVKQSSTPEVSDGGVTATFRADIEDSGSAPYTFYAVSPYSSVVSVSDSYKSIQVEIPASQTPLETSVDEAAQILVAKYPAGASFPASAVAMNFEHLTAYGKISFTNLSLESGEAIASVSLTAAENWAGRYYYYTEDYDTYREGDIVEKSAGKTITLSTTSATDIWFACAPVALGGKQVKVVVATDKGNTYTKRITIPEGKNFESGKVNAFRINMNGIGPDGPVQYDLVTNAGDLTVGSQVIIAAPGATAIAMSTTQNGNNRGQTSVTKSSDGSAITSPGDAVQILTIEAGNKENTIAFSTDEGYLCAASSGSNYLRTETNLTDNSSWTVEIDAESGEATVLAQGEYTRNKMRYNSGSSIFACYASGATTGTPVSLYILSADWQLDNIAVTTAPDKTTYEAGEDFDPAGMVVTAHYVDADDSEHTKDVVIANSDLTFDPATNLEAGTTSVTISYGGKETTQEITVTAPKVWDLQSIAVSTAPDKTTYTEGDFFDPAGLVVTATFENHNDTEETKQETVDNADLTFTPSTSTALTTSDVSVTISYTVSGITKTASQSITVNAAPTGTPGDETFDLTKKTYTTGTNLVTWTGESVVISNSGTNATNYLGGDSNNRTSSRFYNGNNLVINPNSDYTITSIVFTATSTNYASTLGNSSWSNGSANVSGSTVTVTPENGSTSVTATVGGTCGFTSIVVNYLYSGTPAQKYAITIASGIANGSVSADLSEAAEGATVTLTATPSSGYVLDAWDVYKTGELGTKVTVTNNTFTMPAYPVTVSALFTTSGGGGGGDTPVTVSMNSFSELSGYVDGDTNVSYAATKGGAATAPAVNSNEIRIYQNGGLLTITANNGKTITNVTIGSSMGTTVQVDIDNGGYGSDNSISAGGTYSTGTISASSTVVFKCTGTTKTTRLYLNYLSVTYE